MVINRWNGCNYSWESIFQVPNESSFGERIPLGVFWEGWLLEHVYRYTLEDQRLEPTCSTHKKQGKIIFQTSMSMFHVFHVINLPGIILSGTYFLMIEALSLFLFFPFLLGFPVQPLSLSLSLSLSTWQMIFENWESTPWKINMEHTHRGLEDHFPF